jgi:hypothetical protein
MSACSTRIFKIAKKFCNIKYYRFPHRPDVRAFFQLDHHHIEKKVYVDEVMSAKDIIKEAPAKSSYNNSTENSDSEIKMDLGPTERRQ